jgi:hypothetical protein
MFISENLLPCSMLCPETCFFKSWNNCAFFPGKSVAALRSLALMNGLLWASASNAASWAGLDTCHNPVHWLLPTCPSHRYFCSHAHAIDLGTTYSSPTVLALNPPSLARLMMHSRIDLSWWAIMMRMKKKWLELHTPALTHCRQRHFHFYDYLL